MAIETMLAIPKHLVLKSIDAEGTFVSADTLEIICRTPDFQLWRLDMTYVLDMT